MDSMHSGGCMMWIGHNIVYNSAPGTVVHVGTIIRPHNVLYVYLITFAKQ